MKSVLVEYKSMLDSIIESDDESLKQYYGVANKELENADESRKQFYTFVESVRKIEGTADKKDSEKRAFNWKLVGGISFALISVAGVSAGVLGGNFNFKLPKKN